MPLLHLHGYAVSNFFNIVRAALIEKDVRFEICHARASQEPQFLARSPMGKIPVLETPQGWLSETVAILEYIEDTQDGPQLYPKDPYMRARSRQIINIIQMYVEAQARTLYPGVFMGGENMRHTVDGVEKMLGRACGALGRLTEPSPYLLGKQMTYADLFAFYCFDVAERVVEFVYGRSLLAGMAGFEAWFSMMSQRSSSCLVLADFEREFVPYLVDKNAAYRQEKQKWKANA